MSYLVFARRFRPQRFGSISGQEHVTRALANSIVRERIPHALLFTGPRGVGKTSAARVYAKALNCVNNHSSENLSVLDEAEARKQIEPCDKCVNCQEIARSTSIAVREIDGASNNSVDNIRELIESLRTLAPPSSRYKVYIIDEVHMLSTAAFNALLKSLEEPPPNTVFIFATTEPHKIPETVISRCQRYDFRALSTELILERLRGIAKEEKVIVDDEVLRLISRKAHGGMRDAQSMFDKLLSYSTEQIDLVTAQDLFGVLDKDFFFELSAAVFAQDAAECFSLLDRVFYESLDIKSFLADFVTHWRNVLVVSMTPANKRAGLSKLLELSGEQVEKLSTQLEQASQFDVQRLFDIAERSADTAIHTNYPRYVLEAGLAKMATLSSLKPLPEILARLEALSGNKVLQTATQLPPAESAAPAAPAAPEAPPVAGTAVAVVPAEAVEVAPLTPESLPETFDPSWEAFVSFVHKCSELVLGAHLKRVSAVVFELGLLELSGAEFDIDSINTTRGLEALKRCLSSYAGHEQWDVRLKKTKANKAVAAKAAVNSSPAEGSIVARETQAKKDLKARIEKEARSSPLVKAALDTFAGSKIEKVTVLAKQQRSTTNG